MSSGVILLQRPYISFSSLKLEILHLGSSNLHIRYMARKVSLIVIWPTFEKKNGRHITFNVKWDHYPIKKALHISVGIE